MLIEIKSRWDDNILFAADVDLPKTSTPGQRVGAAVIWALANGARLVGANLDGASLFRARLFRARLVGASLVGARLDGALLDGASLFRARLDGASLVGASLDGASLDGARLDGASLVGANGIICLDLHDPRGYRPIAVRHAYTWMIAAGCHWLALDAALRHWDPASYVGDPALALARRYTEELRRLPPIATTGGVT